MEDPTAGHSAAADAEQSDPSLPSEARIEIRVCERREVPEVLALWQQTRRGLGKTDDEPGMRLLLDRDEDALLVAVCGGRIVGTLIAGWDGWRGNMYRLTVHPAWQRRGIASRLIAAGEAALRSRGVRRISALVRSEDEGAVAVWRRADYEHDAGTGRLVKSVRDLR
jgi:ribosomal protein S18 acetylase RimI-like enzyme